MQRVSRLKFIILATIACVVLFCIAAFSVSLAKWTLGDDSNATKVVQGKASNFYVEYPQYASTGSTAVVPPLVADTYYLQVPQIGNTDMSDYYEFHDSDNANYKYLYNVYLHKDDIIDLFNGKSALGFQHRKNNTSDTTNAVAYTVSGRNNKIKIAADGYYSFHYEFNFFTMEVNYAEALAGNTGSTGNTGNTSGTIDTSAYTELFSVKFSDDTQVKKLYFKTGSGATGLFANLGELAASIRANDYSAYYYNHNVHDGSGSGDGNQRKVSYLNKGIINVGTKSKTVISFGFEEKHINDSTTASAVVFLAGYAVDENNYISLHTAKGGTPQLKTSGSGGGGGSESEEITAEEPYCEGSTVFDASSQELNDKKTVRQVTSGAQADGNKYIYKNYICVSRKNSAATDDDNSIAYLEFDVVNSTINPYDVKVTSLHLKRRATDANGNIKNRFVDPAPRIYNYDPNLDTRLGPDNSTNDYSDPNKSNRKPLFARGLTHAASSVEGSSTHMIDHYDDGVYAILYFGDNDQQYFALDIEIELELAAGVTVPAGGFDFTLKAQAANRNSWERYENGYGEPWGYYMGGLINSVETWEPGRTTKLERANDRYVTDYDANLERPKIESLDSASGGNIEQASPLALDAFNALTNFNYKIIKFFKSPGALEGYARYPKGKIDVSLTVNLTEGSLIKIYMLDHDGHRETGHTVYVVPSEIVYDKETKELFRDETYDIYDSYLNIIIPKTGTYIFRLVGYFHTRDEEVEDTNGNILKGDKICFKDGKRYKELNGKAGMDLPNFNLWVDTLYITCSSASESSECAITLDPNGGQFKAEDLREGEEADKPITRTVTFGSDIRNLPKPKLDGKEPSGWYYEDDAGNTYDFDFGSAVTGNMTLKAKYKKQYQITFNANGGNLPSGVTNPVTTDEYGNLTTAQWNAVKPTWSGHKFLGWYTAAEGGTRLGTNTTFTANRTVYAHWEVSNENGVYINGVLVKGLTNNKGNTDGTEYMALDVPVVASNSTLTFWYNNVERTKDIKSKCTYQPNKNGNIILGKGVYNFYYKFDSKDDGLWIALDSTKYIVEFMLNDGSGNTHATLVTGANKKLASFPAEPTRTGFAFGGWFTTSANNASTERTVSFTFAGHTTLYAKWQYTVKFYANGGTWSGDPHTNQVDQGGKVAEPLAADRPTKPANKAFDFWSTSQDGSTGAFNFDTAITGTNTVNGVIKLYAQWANAYTVTFDVDGGSSVDSQTVKHGDKVTKPSDPTKSGYTFDGWYTTSAKTTAWDFNNDTVTSATTIYAKWTENINPTYTITFNANGGTCTTASATTGTDGKLTSLPTPTRDYHTFSGWYTSASDGTQVSTSKTYTADTTIYAHWTAQNGVYAGTTFKKAWTVNPKNRNEQMATGVTFAANDVIVIVYNNTVYDASNKYGIDAWYNGRVDTSTGMFKVTKEWQADLYYNTDKLYVTTSDSFITSKMLASKKEFGVKIKDGFIIIRHDNGSAANGQIGYVSNATGDLSDDTTATEDPSKTTFKITYGTTIIDRASNSSDGSAMLKTGLTMYVNIGESSSNSWTDTCSITITEGATYNISWKSLSKV